MPGFVCQQYPECISAKSSPERQHEQIGNRETECEDTAERPTLFEQDRCPDVNGSPEE